MIHRTLDALSLGALMTIISDLNSFCFVEPVRRVLDDTLRELDEIRLDAQFAERDRERLSQKYRADITEHTHG
jgi:hypothetical protein